MQNKPTYQEKQELAAVFDQANQLNLAGYQLTKRPTCHCERSAAIS